MFAFQDKRGAVEFAFTDRFGGMSAGPFAELNLALPRSVGTPESDEGQDSVDENWDIVVHAMVRGAPPSGDDLFTLAPGALGQLKRVAGMRQVHGAHVEVVEADGSELSPSPEPEADALVTATGGVLLVARAADCVPVLLADVERGVVAAAHAGRKGVAAGVVTNALAAMRDLGARRIEAWVGPHACGRCYEVPAEMRDEVAAIVPEARAETAWGTPAIDLGAAVAAQLRAAVDGVQMTDIVDVGRCTVEDPSLYSYRRDGDRSGRHAGLIWVRP